MSEPAVIYARFSPGNGRENSESIENQESVCSCYCGMRELEPVALFFDPEVSGRKKLFHRRKGGAALLAFIKANNVRHIVCRDLSRFSRNLPDGERWITGWARKGIALHLANEGGNSINSLTADGKLMLRIKLAVSEFYGERVGEDTSGELCRKRDNGEKVGRYHTWEHTEAGKRHIGKLLEKFEETRNFSECAKWLRDSKIPTSGGGVWRHGTVSGIINRVLAQD